MEHEADLVKMQEIQRCLDKLWHATSGIHDIKNIEEAIFTAQWWVKSWLLTNTRTRAHEHADGSDVGYEVLKG